jgi:hypothetical protein
LEHAAEVTLRLLLQLDEHVAFLNDRVGGIQVLRHLADAGWWSGPSQRREMPHAPDRVVRRISPLAKDAAD